MPMTDRLLPSRMSGDTFDGQIDFDETFGVFGIVGHFILSYLFGSSLSSFPSVFLQVLCNVPVTLILSQLDRVSQSPAA